MCGVYRCERRQASNLLAAAVNRQPQSGVGRYAGTFNALDERKLNPMKQLVFFAMLASVAVLVTPGSAQNPQNGPNQNEQRLIALVQQIQTQQAQITANQDKIDSKMAEVTEAVRVARIYAGRGGK
jgi:type IV secretory pathway VirJ component